jgi:hypothetical protein
VQALAGDVMEPPVNGYCFVPRVDVDKHPIAATPTMTAPRQSDDTESSPPTTPAPEKQKPGIKPFRDWPNRFWRLRWCASPMRRLVCCGIALSWSGMYANF